MITRIYVDNFRTLVNFEWKPRKLALLLGDNGAGKSTLLDVLCGLRALLADRSAVGLVFPSRSRTRWDTRLEQRFELDVLVDGQPFSYRLTVLHHASESSQTAIQSETLQSGGASLFEFVSGELQLYTESGERLPKMPLPVKTSALAMFRAGVPGLFLRWIERSLSVFSPDPRSMSSRTDEEATNLVPPLRNLSSWYPRWVVSDFAAAAATSAALKPVLPGFESLNVNWQHLRLEARFTGGGTTWDVDWTELSDGQRQLIGLYVLLHAFVRRPGTVIIDEPDNYVALREIQPWLTLVIDSALSEKGPQVWLLSHHPEILDQLAREFGQQMVRVAGGPTRIEAFPDPDVLAPSELVAGGWNHE